MINTGAWESAPQPHLPKSRKEYNSIFRFGFEYQGFRFLCDLLVDKLTKEDCFFIYPKKTDFYLKTIVFSDKVKISKYWQRDIYNISIENQKLKHLFSNFKENKIFYASDLCRNRF